MCLNDVYMLTHCRQCEQQDNAYNVDVELIAKITQVVYNTFCQLYNNSSEIIYTMLKLNASWS